MKEKKVDSLERVNLRNRQLSDIKSTVPQKDILVALQLESIIFFRFICLCLKI